MTVAAGYDCMVWITGHHLPDDGAKLSITVIGLKTSQVAREQGDDSVSQKVQRVWMSSSVIRVVQCQDNVVTEK